MRIIITDGWLAKTKPRYLAPWQLGAALLALLALGALVGWGLSYTTRGNSAPGALATKDFERLNVDALAQKVGEMQGRLIELDALARRVSGVAGVELPAPSGSPLGQGGLLVQPHSLTAQELLAQIEQLGAGIQLQADKLTLSQARLSEQRLSKLTLPNQAPVLGVETGSGFGWRIDPFTGQRALHTGLDFAAASGTPILAAAGGVVVALEKGGTGYGNHLEIDHGNGLVTRYAHLARSHVQQGDLVRKGQHIADMGSTGRSTGTHLHFEVLVDDAPVDPQRFLRATQPPARTRPS